MESQNIILLPSNVFTTDIISQENKRRVPKPKMTWAVHACVIRQLNSLWCKTKKKKKKKRKEK